MNFARNAQSTLLMQIALALFGLALSIVLARWLTEPERGLYAVVMTFVLLGDYLTQLGMPLALIYRIGRAGTPPARALGAAFQISAAALALSLALSLGRSDWVRDHFLLGAAPAFLWVALVLVALEIFGGLLESAARAIDRFDLRNLYQVGISTVSLAAVSIALVGWHAGPLAALVAVAVARIALGLVFAGFVLRETGFDPRVDRPELRESLRFGLKGYLQLLFGKLHERLDVMVMVWLQLDPAQIAFYAVAVSVIDRLRLVPDAIGSALLPKLAGLEHAETGAYTSRVTRHSLFWVCVSGLGLALVAPPLLPLVFGRGYAASVPVLFVLLPATVLLTVRRVIANYFTASGRPGFNAGVQALAAGVNFALNLWAIPRFGILGAAFASLVSYGFEAFATIWGFRRETGESLRALLLVGRADLRPYAARARELYARFSTRDA